MTKSNVNRGWEAELTEDTMNFCRKIIDAYLKSIDISNEDLGFYCEFKEYLKEGIAKHPDEPGVENSVADYELQDWSADLGEEFEEVGLAVKLYRLNNGSLNKIREELFHLMTVARRMIKFIDQKIAAQEYDP